MLTNGDMRSSIDIILHTFWQLPQKLFRLKSRPPNWVISLIISIIISLIAFIISALIKGISEVVIKTIIFGGVLIFVNFMAAGFTFTHTFQGLNNILKKENLSDRASEILGSWVGQARNVRKPFFVGVIVSVINIGLVFYDPDAPSEMIEVVMMGGFMLMWTGFVFYFMYLFVLLPLKLLACGFQIHRENPASSQILSSWNRMMSRAAYIFALILAAGTLFTLSITPFRPRTLIFIIPRWLLLIVQFIVNQITLSQIIQRSKRATLQELEEKMATLRSAGGTPAQKDLPYLFQLWDYHERLLKTRNSYLNFTGVVNFLSTLLIPLLAFLLATFDTFRDFLNL